MATVQQQFPTPFNAQIGALRFPIACTASGLNITIDGFYTGTAPAYAHVGQPTYITDVTSLVTIPESLTSLGASVGVTHADTLIFLDILSSNTVRETTSVFPNGLWINDTAIATNKTSIISLPPSGVLPPIGPFTAAAAGQAAIFYLGEITGSVYLYNATDFHLGTLDLKCPSLESPISLGSYNVQESTNSTAFVPTNGFAPNFGALDSLEEIGYFNVPYLCDVGDRSRLEFDLFFGGRLFGSAPAGSQLSFTDIVANLQVPQTFADELHQQYSAESFESKVSDVQLRLTNASPLTSNLVNSAVSQTSSYSPSGGFNISIPTTGTLEAGPFTAGPDAGKYMSLSLGNATASLVLKDASESVKACLPVTCYPDGTLNIYDILISKGQ